MKKKPFLPFISVVCYLFFSGYALCEAPEDKTESPEKKPIVINAAAMELDNKLKLATFTGDVKAEKDDFTVACEKMLIYYKTAPDQDKNQEGKKDETTQIDRIIATGHVIINRGQGGVATAEEATYFQEGERMVLTGNPTVTRGKDLVKGEKITIFLAEDRVKVEGSKAQGVNLTISPRHEQK